MTWPIFVNSKGRALNSQTLNLLVTNKIKATVLVEPQDVRGYKLNYPSLEMITLKKSNMGLSYVRQKTLEIARERNLEWYWILDDDIRSFCKSNGKKCIPIKVEEALSEAQRRVSEKTGMVALEYSQIAWQNQGETNHLNSYCDVAVGIRLAACKNLSYNQELKLKVDRDFTIKILTAGWHTLRLGDVAFSVPKNGSNKGGLQSVYASGEETRYSKMLAELYPGFVTVKIKKNGRVDAKIDWKRIHELAI